ncbi:hypothetical protein D3C85_1033290 [compost metagenome]
MYIGNGVAVGKLQLGMFLEKRHHVRRRFEKGVDHGAVELLAQFMFQVHARQRRVFDDAGTPGQWIAGHPHPAAGPGRGTAENSILFHQDDLLPMPGGGDCRRQSCRPRADDQDIAVHRGCAWRKDRHGTVLADVVVKIELGSIFYGSTIKITKRPRCKTVRRSNSVCALPGAL